MAKGSLQLTKQQTVNLNNGVSMPVLGLGLYLVPPGKEAYQSVTAALETGYRLFDTAALYRNEEDVGRAIRDSGVPRRDVFVTTKLWNDDHGYDRTLRAFEASLRRLNLGHIDLYLIHFPVAGLREDSWRAMEQIAESGRARAIGVSNYTIGHLKELLGQSRITPAVNQVEFSPFLYQRNLLEFCRRNRIQVEGYAPLTAGARLQDPRIGRIAAKYGRTNAQVMLRWAIQHHLVVIPKSTHRERIEENAGVFDFELSCEDLQELDGLHDGFRSSWDPTGVP